MRSMRGCLRRQTHGREIGNRYAGVIVMNNYWTRFCWLGNLAILLLVACGGDTESVKKNMDSGAALGKDTNAEKPDTSALDTGKVVITADAFSGFTEVSKVFPNPSATLSQLVEVEKQQLCDLVSANQGGYRRSVRCDGGIQTTDSSQGSCVAGIPTLASVCPSLTAGDLVNCSFATGPDLCKYPNVPECAELFKCLG